MHTSQDRCPCALLNTAVGKGEKENSGFLLLFTRILLIAPSCLFKGMVRLSPYCRFRKTGFLNSWPFNNVSLLPVSLALSF